MVMKNQIMLFKELNWNEIFFFFFNEMNSFI